MWAYVGLSLVFPLSGLMPFFLTLIFFPAPEAWGGQSLSKDQFVIAPIRTNQDHWEVYLYHTKLTTKALAQDSMYHTLTAATNERGLPFLMNRNESTGD